MNKGMWNQTKKWSAKQLLAGVMSAVMLAGMVPMPVQATQVELITEEQDSLVRILENTEQSLTFTGDVLAAVSTRLSTSSQTSGSFYAREGLTTVVEDERLQDAMFNRYVDESTGDEMTVIELTFPELVPQEPPAEELASDSLVEPEASYAVGATKNIVDDEGYYRGVKCLYVGTYCTVWGSTGDAASICLTSAQAKSIGTKFDSYYPSTTSAFGAGYDTDGDRKVAILCYDISKDYYYGTGNTYTAGFFRRADLVDSSGYINGEYFGPSNYTIGMDAIHMDTYPGMGYGSNLMGDISNCLYRLLWLAPCT